MGIYLPKFFIFERILKFSSKKFGSLKNIRTFAIPNGKNAEIAQLVEHNLAKVGVASSSLVFRSRTGHLRMTFVMRNNQTWYNYICSRSLTETAFFFIYTPKALALNYLQTSALRKPRAPFGRHEVFVKH